MICENNLLKELHILVKALNKIENEPGDRTFGVCNKFLRKLTYYFFTIFDEETPSLGNGTLFTWLKENATLIKCFGLMHIDFYEYPIYSGAISEKFETHINAHIIGVIMDTLIQQ